MRRSWTDPAWADEVIRRWERRRWHVQQRDAAVAEFKQALQESALGRGVYAILDWLAVRLG